MYNCSSADSDGDHQSGFLVVTWLLSHRATSLDATACLFLTGSSNPVDYTHIKLAFHLMFTQLISQSNHLMLLPCLFDTVWYWKVESGKIVKCIVQSRGDNRSVCWPSYEQRWRSSKQIPLATWLLLQPQIQAIVMFIWYLEIKSFHISYVVSVKSL